MSSSQALVLSFYQIYFKFTRKHSGCLDNAFFPLHLIYGVRMRRAARSGVASEWPVCVRRGTRGGTKRSRPPLCYIRPEDHDVQAEVPDRVGGNRRRISTVTGDPNWKRYTQPSLFASLFGPGSSQMALAARHGSSYLTLDSSFPFVIHSRPGRKRSTEPVAGCNIWGFGCILVEVCRPWIHYSVRR